MEEDQKSKPVRCKFICYGVDIRRISNKLQYAYKFQAVYGNDGGENSKFFAATPAGQLEIGAFSADLFDVGQEYYLDIIPAKS